MSDESSPDDVSGTLHGDQARLRWMSKVFMDAADPILVEDLDGCVIDMNHEAERSYGFSRDELLGKPILAIVPDERHEQAQELLLRCKRGDDVRNIEGLRRHKNGDVIPVLITLSLLGGEQGEAIGIASLAKDITEQKRSEEELRTLSKVFMEAADPILIEDLDGRVIEMNQEAERSYGWSRERLIGKPILVIVPVDRHEQARELLERCKAGEVVRNVEGLRQSKFGEVRSVLLTLSLLRDDDGEPTGIASIAKDITEQKQAEKQLRAMSKVFMESADPILIEDLEGVVTQMNDEAERAYGWSREELVGKPIRTLVPESRHDQAFELLALCRAGEDVRNVEGVRCTKAGQEIPVLLTLSMLRDDENVAVGIASLAKDITAQKAVEKELRDYRDHLEEIVAQRTAELEIVNDQLAEAKLTAEDANHAKSSFLASMSHELRTPMNAIIGYSEMLLEDAQDDGNDDLASDLSKIRGAGRHLLALINDVLDLAKIEAGKMDLFVESFELRELLDDVESTVDALVQKKRNRFQLEVDGELGAVRADLTKVRQILFNLISNAAKFTEEGLITLSVSRSQDADGDWIDYAVSDTGIGIPADKIGGLFDEFSQVDASTTRDYGGTGLGLSITKRFCDMMGGEVAVESELGSGSTFRVRLPAQVQEPAEELQASADASVPVPESASILVIDDDPIACDLIRRSLERDGHTVAIANGADEGIQLARELRPQLITLDILMPGKDGWSALRELKSDPYLSEIPVVMISMIEGSEMGYSLGATDFLSKPVDRDQLRVLLSRYAISPETGQVLVVDDEENTRALLRRVLEKQGYAVAEAANGREALERVAERRPDLILLDLMMPVMDGFEFTNRLRAVDAWCDIPVIVATAKDLTSEDRAALSGLVEGVLQKHACSLDELMDGVSSALAAGRLGAPSQAD